MAPHSWRESGGAGSVRFFDQKLFVTTTEPNHRQVERLVGLMEAHGAGRGAAPAAGGPAMGGGMMMPGYADGPARRPLGLRPPAERSR